jgi:Protein of unknown function (DUF3175)
VAVKRKPARARRKGARRAASGRWSQRVTRESNALDLEHGVFAKRDPRAIARSLKRSARQSRRRKAGEFQSAMSMLNFFVNRAGRQLSATQRRRLEKAKDELRALYGRTGRKRKPKSRA